jgi:hypothetical protein
MSNEEKAVYRSFQETSRNLIFQGAQELKTGVY